MRHIPTAKRRKLFDVLTATRVAQAAMMTLRSGQSTSDAPENEHPRCEQWLFVIRGTGRAIVGRRRAILQKNALLLIERGEPHQITCTSRTPLVTLNLYVPPAYADDGELRPSAKRA